MRRHHLIQGADIGVQEGIETAPALSMPPAEVCINPIPEDAEQAILDKGVNFPTLQRAIAKVT